MSADANRLKWVAPSVLASEQLWLGRAPPNWVHENYSLKAPHWRPWLDWYQRRLDGREAAEDIELLFATLPVDPREKDVAEQNAELARRIAELQEARNGEKRPPAGDQWDFFISYSSKDEADAREIVGILEQAGHSTFAQFKDIAPGNNFVREMQNGLESSQRFVALLSPDYEESDHCQAEWAAAYNRDPGGAGRKILPLLLRQTKLSSLASQIVFVNLVGLSGEARRQAILRALAPKPLPKPVENISAPFDFGWNAAHRVTVVAGPQNTPVFPFAGSDRDHHDRLDACRKTVERLIADLAAQRFNARPDYRITLETYLDELPAAPGSGNLLLADAEARVLRGLFEEDANILARALAERLNRILEFHIALRPFYPGVGRFYDDVRSGALSAPLPRDAIASFVEVVREHTPDIFEQSVSQGIDRVEEDFAPHPAAPAPQLEPGVLVPRPDPIEAPNPEKVQAFSITSTINAVYGAFLKGKDMGAAIKGWDDVAKKLGEHVEPVIEFLKNFTPGG
ncbi:toll/interleukin-1 receptor domain-containing protein [Methylocystis hirsuta]|uniref:Toll/interleukin-1 receptor domain-containing protein n=1 Tax=Methylocystis hirsuta TaxID=369798 RepID=A0A3M9XSJ4_9HYPH|nr:toll/interleukin-1 receptor domain-containing protein [Methylocystis hirsuta]